MRWEDERYVRVYTRDTATWMMLSWQARAVLLEMFRKCDRAGIVEMGEHGVDGLAAVLRMPSEVVGMAIPELALRKCIEVVDSRIVIPNFIAAQEAKQSDKARQRAQRERARDTARAGIDPGPPPTSSVPPPPASVTPRDGTVTPCDSASRRVTERHADSAAVTLSCAVPSRADPPNPHGGGGGSDGLALDMAPDAYLEGIAIGTGRRVPPLNWKARKTLIDAARIYAGDRTGQALLDWIREDAAAYVRATEHAADKQCGYAPHKWAEWHVAGCMVGPQTGMRLVRAEPQRVHKPFPMKGLP